MEPISEICSGYVYRANMGELSCKINYKLKVGLSILTYIYLTYLYYFERTFQYRRWRPVMQKLLQHLMIKV